VPELVGALPGGQRAHRADTPEELWLDLLTSAEECIDLFANASLFLPEENPEAIDVIKAKARAGRTGPNPDGRPCAFGYGAAGREDGCSRR
jgi:hypothetical protein